MAPLNHHSLSPFIFPYSHISAPSLTPCSTHTLSLPEQSNANQIQKHARFPSILILPCSQQCTMETTEEILLAVPVVIRQFLNVVLNLLVVLLVAHHASLAARLGLKAALLGEGLLGADDLVLTAGHRG